MKKMIIILFVLIMSLYAVEGRGQNGRGMSEERGAGRLREELNLTDEQYGQLQEMQQQFHSQNRALHDELRILHVELFQVYDDSVKCNVIADRAGEIHHELTILTAEKIRNVATVLTEEQLQKFIEIRQEFRPMRHPQERE